MLYHTVLVFMVVYDRVIMLTADPTGQYVTD